MPLNITVHSSLSIVQGVASQAPSLDGNTTAQVVALGGQSTVLNGPALLILVADEDQRISFQTTAGYSAPLVTGVKLKAGVERYVTIGSGPSYLSCVAG